MHVMPFPLFQVASKKILYGRYNGKLLDFYMFSPIRLSYSGSLARSIQ